VDVRFGKARGMRLNISFVYVVSANPPTAVYEGVLAWKAFIPAQKVSDEMFSEVNSTLAIVTGWSLWALIVMDHTIP
jgi:hypothetical protein